MNRRITNAKHAKNEVDELKRNGSGYIDPTAEKALKNVTLEEKRVSNIIKEIKTIAAEAGFEVAERIVLRDKKTGALWR